MNKKIGILHLEDSLNDSELIHSIIESGEIGNEYFLAENENDFLNFLDTENIDIILSDYSLPDYNGNDALKIVREKYSHIPFIFVSGAMGEDRAIDAMLNGATDYVLKNKLERLVPAIKRALHEHELAIKQKQAEINLREKNEQIEAQNERNALINKELVFQNKEKEKRADELVIANKELAFQNKEKEKRAAELIIANKELLFQNEEKEKRAEELIIANKELEQFAYVASHDLQEPLRMVASYTQLLERRYKDKLDQDANDFIQYAVDGSARMQRLINDLLDYSRISSRGREFTKVDILHVLGQVISNLQYLIIENTALITNDELPEVEVDESQILRVFQNLIENAIKFKKKSEMPKIHISCKEENDFYEFSVRDNGIGMDMQFHDRVFTIFQRLHSKEEYPGTGIGLSICKRIIERHGGKIWFESKENEGTTFYFTLKI